jgi:two-component system, NtrC family, phosphoglycerate transport system sensor histidine kinase PgtB
LILMSLLSLLTAASVLWFYVRRNIVARLNSLSQSMQAIAEGDLTHEIQKIKDDEIGHMTSALKVFRGTAQAMEEANVKLRLEVQERKKVQNELVQAGKMAALGQMSTGIAHELNQPLSAIRHYLHNARLLLERGETATHEQNLVKVVELTERMAKMINHLKTFARWPANKLSPVDLSASIEQALALFAGRIKQDKILVKKIYSPAKLKVLAEDIRLEQVLVNIIGNAVDAVSEEGITDKQITIEVTELEEELSVGVIDNGAGIKADDLELIFDPFYTTKEVGKGLGLGLSISYNIIKDFGGHIEAIAESTGGTRFTITLKRAQD